MAFPVNGVLDSFTRANATPPGGSWSGKIFSTDVDLGVVTNHLEQPAGGGQGSAVWNVAVTNDQEAYITASNSTDVSDTHEIWVRGTNLGTTTPNGYALRWVNGGGAADTLQIFKVVAGVYTQLGSTFTGAIVTGEKIGIEVIGTAIKAYHFTGGAWVQRISTSDSSQTSGKLAVLINATNDEFDDFGGGSLAAAVVLPTPPLPRAFQEQGAIYSGEVTGFQPLAFQIPDPTRAFQENDAFQPQAFQLPDPTVAFQPEAFDGFTSFQMSVLAFQEPTGFQGDAFQEYTGLERRTPRSIVVSNNSADESRDRFLKARQHRQARILRAPQAPPAAAPTVVKQSITVVEDRRAVRMRTRRRKPILLRAPFVSAAPRKPVLETTSVSRSRVVARLRRRKPQVLHAPLAAPVPRRPTLKTATLSRSRVLARVRRRKPLLLHAPLAAQPPTSRVQVHGRIRPKLARLRQRRPILLRAPSTPTPAPQTGIPVKRIFVYEDRRAAFVKAKRRARIILRAPSVPTPVPLVRVNVKVVQRKRSALVARLRHDQAIVRRAPVAVVRAPKQIVVRQKRRVQKKRSRALVLRSAPLWQRPGYAKITVAKRKRQPLVARARRKLRYLVSHVYGPPPPPPTDSAFGLVFISDVPVYGGSLSDVAVFQVGVADASGYALALIDGSLYRVSIDDLNAGGSVALSDIPGH